MPNLASWSDRVLTFIQSFGLSAEKVFEKAQTLTEKLAAAKDEKFVEKDNGENENAEAEVDCVN